MKKWLLVLFILGLVGASIGAYMFFKPLPGMEDLNPDVQMEATALYQAFEQDEAGATNTYLGKIVEVSGTLLSVEAGDGGGSTLVLDAGGLLGGVLCRMEDGADAALTSLKEGQTVHVRGECVGMLMDVELSRCILLSQTN